MNWQSLRSSVPSFEKVTSIGALIAIPSPSPSSGLQEQSRRSLRNKSAIPSRSKVASRLILKFKGAPLSKGGWRAGGAAWRHPASTPRTRRMPSTTGTNSRRCWFGGHQSRTTPLLSLPDLDRQCVRAVRAEGGIHDVVGLDRGKSHDVGEVSAEKFAKRRLRVIGRGFGHIGGGRYGVGDNWLHDARSGDLTGLV